MKNAELNVDLNAPQQRNWTVKWLMVDNFLSFGENNYLPFSKRVNHSKFNT
jgi:hypothetical protein